MNITDINIPAWEGFVGGQWQKDIDTAVFVRLKNLDVINAIVIIRA